MKKGLPPSQEDCKACLTRGGKKGFVGFWSTPRVWRKTITLYTNTEKWQEGKRTVLSKGHSWHKSRKPQISSGNGDMKISRTVLLMLALWGLKLKLYRGFYIQRNARGVTGIAEWIAARKLWDFGIAPKSHLPSSSDKPGEQIWSLWPSLGSCKVSK